MGFLLGLPLVIGAGVGLILLGAVWCYYADQLLQWLLVMAPLWHPTEPWSWGQAVRPWTLVRWGVPVVLPFLQTYAASSSWITACGLGLLAFMMMGSWVVLVGHLVLSYLTCSVTYFQYAMALGRDHLVTYLHALISLVVLCLILTVTVPMLGRFSAAPHATVMDLWVTQAALLLVTCISVLVPRYVVRLFSRCTALESR